MASLNELLYDIRRIAEHREQLTDKKIKKIYRSLMDDLSAFVGKQYVKYADEDGRLYVSYLDSKNARAKFLQEIVENVDNITPEVQAEIVNLVNETYEKSYKGMSEALLKVDTADEFAKVSKDIAVNPNVLRQAVNNNIAKLTLPAVLEKHRNEVIYQIQQELNIGLMQGDRYEKMTKRISERIGVSYSKAQNIVRTESHRNVESGFMDCAEHIQEGLDGSELIYAATWRTMKDERVRPQQRRKTKKGWKTTYSKNGANHMKMEGVTVKAGELFDLGNGVKAKAPSQSGVAAHDCQCRCFLEYNLMTVEEFAKATGQSVESVYKKYFEEDETDDVGEGFWNKKNDGEFKQIKNDHSLEQDCVNTNPNFAKDIMYQTNCGNCCATYEMRRRGYDVEAKPSDSMSVGEWRKLFTNFKPIRLTTTRKAMIVPEMRREIIKWGDGARGSVFIKPEGATIGHFFSIEVVGDKVRFIDAQHGYSDVEVYFDKADPSSIIYGRWDNLKPSDLVTNACKGRKRSK